MGEKHVLCQKVTVQMGKKGTAPGNLPSEGVAKTFRVDPKQFQAIDAGKVSGGGFGHLLSRRKVDKTIRQINRRAPGRARLGKCRVLLGAENLVNDGHGCSPVRDPFDTLPG